MTRPALAQIRERHAVELIVESVLRLSERPHQDAFAGEGARRLTAVDELIVVFERSDNVADAKVFRVADKPESAVSAADGFKPAGLHHGVRRLDDKVLVPAENFGELWNRMELVRIGLIGEVHQNVGKSLQVHESVGMIDVKTGIPFMGFSNHTRRVATLKASPSRASPEWEAAPLHGCSKSRLGDQTSPPFPKTSAWI